VTGATAPVRVSDAKRTTYAAGGTYKVAWLDGFQPTTAGGRTNSVSHRSRVYHAVETQHPVAGFHLGVQTFCRILSGRFDGLRIRPGTVRRLQLELRGGRDWRRVTGQDGTTAHLCGGATFTVGADGDRKQPGEQTNRLATDFTVDQSLHPSRGRR